LLLWSFCLLSLLWLSQHPVWNSSLFFA
jgi:hypothetical protein